MLNNRTSNEATRRRASFFSALALTLAGCGALLAGAHETGGAKAKGAPPADSAAPAAKAFESGGEAAQGFGGTTGVSEKKRQGAGVSVLRSVRTASHAGFDRVVFEFDGRAAPGYHVEYVDRPVRRCGSGEAVSLAGDAWLRVRLEPSQAHTEQGEATVRSRERRLRHRNLREMKLVCDFEGQVEWVFGVRSPNRYRVLELRNPTRLVVDVRR